MISLQKMFVNCWLRKSDVKHFAGSFNVQIKNEFRMFKVCRYGKVMVQNKESRSSNWSLENNVKVPFLFPLSLHYPRAN